MMGLSLNIGTGRLAWRGVVPAGFAALLLMAPSPSAFAAGILSQHGAVPAPVASSITSNLQSQAQAAAIAQQSQSALSRIATALAAMQTAQTAARNIAQSAPSTVPNGLTAGGLVPDSGLAAPGVANPVHTWVGAQTPTQSTAGGQTNVSINQTAAKAILSWNDFNVGKNTTVTFNQLQPTWVALNKIAPSGVPSQILGAIKAPGQVYLINQNGIIFGGASQVNVGALIASSATIADSDFLSTGIYSTQTTPESGFPFYNPSFTAAGGAITVAPGAQITAASPASITTGGGAVLLMGTKVSNGGTITTPSGQAELAAGDDFIIRQGFTTPYVPSVSTPIASSNYSSTRGNEIEVALNKDGSSLTGGAGLVANTGIITAATGDITLAGETVVQNGALVSTTTLATRGTIHLLASPADPSGNLSIVDPFGNVTIGADSLTVISPDLASTATAFDSQRAALISDSAINNAANKSFLNENFIDLSKLPDQTDESRVEIVASNTVEFQGGAQTMDQGGQVAVSALNRIQTDTGALIDVSGTPGVSLPVSANDIAVSIQSFETRDNPQNRLTQLLRNNTVYVDSRTLSQIAAGAGGYATARDYTAGGLLEVSGYLATTGHTIGEWTALGGNITLATGSAGSIVAQTGAIFNIEGGSIQYQPGMVKQSYLLGNDGRVYNVNTAPAYITYAGVFNGFVDNHPAWGVSQTYANVLSDPAQIMEAGYTEGRNAGSLTLDSPTSLFNATLDAGAVNGPGQTKAAPAGFNAVFPLDKFDPYTLAQNVAATPGSLVISHIFNGVLQAAATQVSFTGLADDLASAVTASSNISADLIGTTTLQAQTLSQDRLGGLAVLTNDRIDVTAPLAFAPGATISLFGSGVTIAAALTDPSGTVTVGNYTTIAGNATTLAIANPVTGKIRTGNIVLAGGGAIDTAGLWTNLALDPNGPNNSAFVNGGAVSVISATNVYDNAGSVINASAGAVIAANGTGTGGSGGTISLVLVDPAVTKPTAPLSTGDLTLNGSLRSTGFSTGGGKTPGGALALSSPAFLIGDAQNIDVPGIVTLRPDFFSAGFSSYTLNGQTAIVPGTAVNVAEPTEQFTPASVNVPTGGAVDAGATLALLPVYSPNAQVTSLTQRPGASLTITGGYGFDLPVGSAITVDPQQAINIAAYGQVTIDGDLTAPGGNITLTNSTPVGLATTLPTYQNGQVVSVWVGATSTISTAAVPFTAADGKGDSVAIAPSGGSINIAANDASVIVQSGARLDASGSAATEQPAANVNPSPVLGAPPQPNPPIQLQGAGGTISLASDNGLFLYGTMLAPAGGPDAAGGTLALALNSDFQFTAQNVSDAPRILTISAADTAPGLPADLLPGAADPALVRGAAQISAAQIDAGGFGTLNFSALDAFLFEGDVTLSAAQSITLSQGRISESTADGAVTLAAPYVRLNGTVRFVGSVNTNLSYLSVAGISPVNSTGAFTVDAGLIDLSDFINFGGIESMTTAGTSAGSLPVTTTTDLNGFAAIDLNGTDAIRFIPPVPSTTNATVLPAQMTSLLSAGDVNLSASVIYSIGTASVVAGYTPFASANFGSFKPGTFVKITRAPGSTPAAPEDVGGTLSFYAANILDAGAVWNPRGTIVFGPNKTSFSDVPISVKGDPNAKVELLAGSYTSVSAAPLSIPFGGTTDGISFANDGAGITALSGAGTITLEARQINVAHGATLDLSGGGTFNGVGFISGAGGSVDVLTTPLLQTGTGGVSAPTLAADQVYAIVAGPQPLVPPITINTQTGATGSAVSSGLGQQIIIPAGVPGLPAGRYTLLPASYALNAGGYRVEFDGTASLAAPPVLALPNGSYAVSGQTGIADTNVQSTLPTNFTITPAATVLTYADYNTENVTQFALAHAALFGAPQPALPADAGTLQLVFPTIDTASLTDFGVTDFAPAAGGAGGTLQITGTLLSSVIFDIYGVARPSPIAGTVALSASAIDAFNAPILDIGKFKGGLGSAAVGGITLENGATLTASRVTLTATRGGITLESGSSINTLGRGTLISDSTTVGPYVDGGASVLDVGNGYITYQTFTQPTTAYGAVDIQGADTQKGLPGATIYTDGSIAISTGATVTISDTASYGAAFIDLAIPEINIGEAAAVHATAEAGLTLTPAILQALAKGVPAAGIPETQILQLSATDSFNFFGTTGIDLSGSNVQLVINSPAIYGFGSSTDVATIKANTIVWNGDIVYFSNFSGAVPTSATPGVVLKNGAGTGAGTLEFDAKTIIFGFSALDRPVSNLTLNRLTLGFGTVDLNAFTEVTSNNAGTLAVYQSPGASYGMADTGGVLNINTPLLTAGNAAITAFTAGGAINVASPKGVTPATALAETTAGGELDLTAPAISIDSAIILPSGKLDIQTAQTTTDPTFGSAADINLAGATGTVLGHATYGAGGSLIVESSNGNISEAAGAVIDVSAINNNAGAVTLTAMDKGQGAVTLDGKLIGGSSGANPGSSGVFNIRAQTLGGGDPNVAFAALNTALDAGGFFGARAFEIGQGDLTINQTVSAKSVSISLDAGTLTENGTIDASFGSAGSIALAAADNLIISPTAVLDAQGKTMQLDSYGQPIDAANAPQISLTATSGAVMLDSGATINLDSADGVARGNLEINVPRTGGNTDGDAGIQAATGLNITGAATVAVNAFATYQVTPETCKKSPCSASGNPVGLITQTSANNPDGVNLDSVNADSTLFITNANTNQDLAGRLAGLTELGSAFHLRPGVDITTLAADPTEDLTVQGDLNLAGYRYGPAGYKYGQAVNAAVYGSGEPGVLTIRAGGNLNVYGSITDGFASPPKDTKTGFATGWVLYSGKDPYNEDQIIPISVTLAQGSQLGGSVNYKVPIAGGTLSPDTVIPVNVALKGKLTVTASFIATSTIKTPDGTVYAVGTVVPALTAKGKPNVLPAGTTIAAGGSLPFSIRIGPVTWPPGIPLPIGASVSTPTLTLKPGSIIPAGSVIHLLVKGAPVHEVALRPSTGGTQGPIYPLGRLLPAGDLSWSIQLVGGANIAAADPGAVQAASSLATAQDTGNITLSDTHYGPDFAGRDAVPTFSVIRTGTGSLSLLAGGAINEESDYGIYTAGAQAPGVSSAYELKQGQNAPGGTLLGTSKKAKLLTPLAADYQANYPLGGGNVLLSAQGDLNGFVSTNTELLPNGKDIHNTLTPTDSIASWLWLQGGAGQPAAWWVEFGALAISLSDLYNNHRPSTLTAQLNGFQGIGTLGGGNLTVQAGGDATDLNLAVAATGRILPGDSTPAQTGGGNLSVSVGGTLTSLILLGRSPGEVLVTDLRGDTAISAGSIGTIAPSFASTTTTEQFDPRTLPPLQTEFSTASAGIDLAPGDGAATVNARGDVVINSVDNPGLQNIGAGSSNLNGVHATPVDVTAPNGKTKHRGGVTVFSLWSAKTSVTLDSAGGDVAPLDKLTTVNNPGYDLFPPTLSVVAQNGDIDFFGLPLELTPAANGTLDLLAAGSIYGAAQGVSNKNANASISGADPSLEATPFNPEINVANILVGTGTSNQTSDSSLPNSPFFAFGVDTPTFSLHPDGQAPALVLAGTDIVDLNIGQVVNGLDYVAAIPFTVAAGRDIVGNGIGTAVGVQPDIFLNLTATDTTAITAGRDILESSFDIAGPGNLTVQAGRDIYQVPSTQDPGGVLESVGPLYDITPGNRDGGAGITAIAGTGAAGPDYSKFADLFVNPDSTLTLQDSSAILAENDAALLAYLTQNFGYTGDLAGAYARFQKLSAAQQDEFLLTIYDAMLNQSGLEFNEPASVRFKSYILGRDAIAALFPSTDAAGSPIAYAGSIELASTLNGQSKTTTSNSGIQTDFGGAIQILTPGGQTIVGTEGVTPEQGQTLDSGFSGVITQGSGNIDIYALGSVLLGESRVLTTFGGNILVWSAQGDINAGRGNKTSINFPPLQRVYDNYGNVVISPSVPTTGAGIGTLNPIPEVAAGNINLVAPLGTVDAGEAGVRSSGNLNIAAAHVANGANLSVGGTSSGVPTAPSVNVGALTGASNSAGAAAQAAQSTNKTSTASPLPSIWLVEILGYGNSAGAPPAQPSGEDQKKKKKHSLNAV
jgi:filamentous hemagglutinin family protein